MKTPLSRLQKMPKHTHDFVESYQGLVGYGADRETDENTLIYYLQKFSDDRFMSLITKRMTDEEMLELFDLLNRLLKNHLEEALLTEKQKLEQLLEFDETISSIKEFDELVDCVVDRCTKILEVMKCSLMVLFLSLITINSRCTNVF